MFFSVIYFNIITAQSRYTKTTVVGRGAEHYVLFKKIGKVLNRINIFFGHSSFPFDSEKYLQKKQTYILYINDELVQLINNQKEAKNSF